MTTLTLKKSVATAIGILFTLSFFSQSLRASKIFIETPLLENQKKFWMKIFLRYGATDIVIHDSSAPNFIRV